MMAPEKNDGDDEYHGDASSRYDDVSIHVFFISVLDGTRRVTTRQAGKYEYAWT
jgi:hypothetical protein